MAKKTTEKPDTTELWAQFGKLQLQREKAIAITQQTTEQMAKLYTQITQIEGKQ